MTAFLIANMAPIMFASLVISLPIMLRYGYDRRMATGIIAASGTLAQIIPPSLVLIVMADQLGKSVGDMYEGAFVPGLVLAGLYALYAFFVTLIFPKAAPGLPAEAIGFREKDGSRGLWSLLALFIASCFFGWFMMRNSATHGADFVVLSMFFGILFAFFVAVLNWIIDKLTGFRFLSAMAQQTTFVMVPPLFLIFLVLGTIFIGVATPTEGGAMGASGAIIMALIKRRLDWKLLTQAVEYTANMTSFVIFILIGSTVFSLVFRGVNGDLWVEHLLTGLPGGALGFLIVVNVLIFFLAFFLDYFEIAFIMVPLLAPVAQKLGIDLVWFGVLLAVNMQTSFLHPPFGFALFYLRSVASKDIKTSDIYWGAIPFVCIQILMVAIVIAFPGIVTSHVSKASGAISGTGADEIRRQLDMPAVPEAPASGPGDASKPGGGKGAATSEIERMLNQQK